MGETSAPRPDGAGFDPEKVPEGPAGDWFRSGRDGAGLSDEEYDIMKQRWLDAGATPPWEEGKADQA